MQIVLTWLESLAAQIPPAQFVFIGALVEEIIAPIPSPLVMLLAGTVAASQSQSVLFLFFLACVGSLSKTFGGLIMYVIADKAEDVIVDKFGKFLGVSHKDTEGFGKYLGKGMKDDIAVFLLRAIPIIPTAPVSVLAGILKINRKTYVLSTFFGLILRNCIYLYLGYTSVGALESLAQGFDSLEKIGYVLLAVILSGAILWMYRKRQQGNVAHILDRLLTVLKK